MRLIRLSEIKIRTFGWVQNPSDFVKLKKVVQIFDHTSETHANLVNERLPRLVEERDGRDLFISLLSQIPLNLKYVDLVGTSFNPRSSARCNGIVQATIEGQGSKEFIDDWSSDGFIRWAHALGFIEYDHYEDSFFITQLGFDYSRSANCSDCEKSILVEALLSYPPAVRVLDLLSTGEHLTKFEIGRRLGFNGESGFTSLPLNILLNSLASCDSTIEKNKIRSDWEGSSDKYARMISGWLSKLGLVEKKRKNFTITFGGLSHSEYITHAFRITGEGLRQLRRAKGTSSARRIQKRVHWEMLATKNLDRIYIRTRRANILKTIEAARGSISLESIKAKLQRSGFDESIQTIQDDIEGLINIGLNIGTTESGYRLRDTINDFPIPVSEERIHVRSSIENIKAEMREQLTELSHDYIELIEIAQDPSQNRPFEMKVMELFIKEYGFAGAHLGGTRKPDGAMYHDDSYGIIVDTKAYSNGYSLPISQADEMERYVRENTTRNQHINPNKWWEIFPTNIDEYKFLFVSGYFKGSFENQLERINLSTGIQGGALNVENLLLGAEYLKRGVISLHDIQTKFVNKEIEF